MINLKKEEITKINLKKGDVEKMENKNTIEAIKNDIQSLRGAEVKIFGQSTTLASEVDDLKIDILDILDNLEKFEVETIQISKSCEHCEGTGEVSVQYEDEDEETIEECEECDGFGIVETDVNALEALEILYDNQALKELKSNNSYNWLAPVSNNFDYKVYKNANYDKTYVEFMVHRFGDVRCNYTDSVVLEVSSEYEFLEAICEADKTISVDGYDCRIAVLSDTIEVTTEDGDHVGNVCASDIEELKEELKSL